MVNIREIFEKWVIVEEIVVLRTGKNGWTQELNLVSWYGKEPKYDIRWWSPNKERSGSGITLRPDELFKLIEVISTLKC